MTDPLHRLDRDPIDGRRIDSDPARPTAAEGSPAPEPRSTQFGCPRRRRGFAPALAGGFVGAVLVASSVTALGLIDLDDAPTPAVAAVARSDGRGDVSSIYAAASKAVVSIGVGAATGTGFVLDSSGTIVTNAHVVGENSTVRVRFSDDRTVAGQVTGVDVSSDLAVIQVAGQRRLTALELADSDAVKTGQLAVAIGSPFGLSQTATAGIVSGTGRNIRAPDGFQIDSVIQTDAPINSGNSGGPLLDSNGRVIGVNSQIAMGGSGAGNVGIGFAVPANTVADVVPRLEKGERIERAYLGLSTAATNSGVTVRAVAAGGPAATAGVQVDDLIVAVAGKRIAAPEDVASAIDDLDPGSTVKLELRRAGDLRQLDVVLTARPAQSS